MAITQLLDNMWQRYLELNPDARVIYQLFSDMNHGEIVNDHIALRTFDIDSVSIDKLAAPFINAGYYFGGEYFFPEKKLYAKHFQHDNLELPKIFISELLVEELSVESQQIIARLVNQLDHKQVSADDFCYSGRCWDIHYHSYLKLLEESEYAAWLSAFGYQPNHFTVSVNHLDSHQNLKEVGQFLLDQGIVLNTAGGIIKGSPEDLLEQLSTMANSSRVLFEDRVATIPGCYYEFAYRYPMGNGSLYQGFIANSANKIFESTDVNAEL